MKVGTDIGTGTEEDPEPAEENYDESTMENPYLVSDTLTISFVDISTVSFSAVLDGADALNTLPNNGTSAIINSAALHTENGKVFSYKRFPRISVSDSVDLYFTWQIGF